MDRRVRKWRKRVEADRPFTYAELWRAFDDVDGRAIELEESLPKLEEEYRRQHEEFAQVEALRDDIVGAIADIEADLEAGLMEGGKGSDPASTDASNGLEPPGRTRHSRRGPIGIRKPILRVMQGSPDREWTVKQVYQQLRMRGHKGTQPSVQSVLARMTRAGELERTRHGVYRLSPAGKEEME